jgi:hypothetical protein
VGSGQLDASKRRYAAAAALFARGRLEPARDLMTEDQVNHDPPPGRGPTREDVRATARLAGILQRGLGNWNACGCCWPYQDRPAGRTGRNSSDTEAKS